MGLEQTENALSGYVGPALEIEEREAKGRWEQPEVLFVVRDDVFSQGFTERAKDKAHRSAA
jgi:hypothetical protein